MPDPYRTAYFVMDLILFFVWAILFIRRKDLRVEMLVMSSLILFSLGIAGIWFFNYYIIDYWSPQYLGALGLGDLFRRLGLMAGGTEDIFFVFLFSGISAVIYEEILGRRHLIKTRKKSLKFLVIFPIVMFIAYFTIAKSNMLNVIYADFIGYFICASIIWYFRRDLLRHSLLSGFFMGGFFFLFYSLIYVRIYPGIFHQWWILNKTSDIFLLGVPLEEILWAFFLGLWVGPAYELIMGLRDGK